MTTLADHIDDFLADVSRRRDWRPGTQRAYRNDLLVIAQRLSMPLAAITEAEVDLVLQDTTVAIATRYRRAAALNQFFLWAQRQKLCTRNPLTDYELPRRERRLPRPIRAHHDRHAVDAAIKKAPLPYRLIFSILRETGMRANKVLQLNVSDVMLDAGREGLLVRGPKNRVERIQVLGPTATPNSVRGLRAYMKTLGKPAPHEPLFRSNRATRISYHAPRYQWQKVCVAAKLLDADGKPLYTVHQLRHTRGTELTENGQRLEIVQRVLGHKDPRSTQVYADMAEYQVRQALEAG